MKFVRRTIAVFFLLFVASGLLFYRYPLWTLDQTIRFTLWKAHVASKFIDVGGDRLHYYEALPPAGAPERPLILIHGLGARGEDWAKLIPGFASAGFHVYVPDLLGYGRSSKPDVDYSIGLEEEVVIQFMRAQHLPRADVIGWSMGGWIAMKLALDRPAMVDRLAVYDTAGTYFPVILPPGLFTPGDVDGVQRLLNMLEPEPRTIPRFIAKDLLRKQQKTGWVVNRSLAAMTSGRSLLDFRLAGLREPMLIMWGGSDHLIPASVGLAIHQAVPQSVFEVVNGCGHLAPAECSKPFLDGTVEFLKAQPPLKRGEKTFLKPSN